MGFADAPFEAHYAEVLGHSMHYVDEGSGPVLLFLHGNPTSSYLWRNIIKELRSEYRCIAPDLIGFGQSDKPPLDYRFLTHYSFIEAFVEQLGLEHVTLVVHDWGGPLGFLLAQQQPERVDGIAFMETFPFTLKWSEFPPLGKPVFRGFRRPRLGRILVMWQNLFINLVLPMGVKRHLPRSVMASYRAPFRDIEDRYPILVWPNELPLDDQRGETREVIEDMEQRLPSMPQRLLLLWFRPGALIRKRQVQWLREHIPHLETRYCGEGLHYVQEDEPEAIAGAVREWLSRGASTSRAQTGSPEATQTTSALAGDVSTFYWRRLRHGDETLVAVWSEQGLAGLAFVDADEDPAAVAASLLPDVRPVEATGDNTDWLDPATPLHWTGTDFQQRVWHALQAIPSGETRTYKQIAEQLGSQPRAVGQAVGANRIALRVPCHRVVPSSGGTGSYRWGKARKQRLLAAEKTS
jgi:O-6-methylguanine DNA methyltransferase